MDFHTDRWAQKLKQRFFEPKVPSDKEMQQLIDQMRDIERLKREQEEAQRDMEQFMRQSRSEEMVMSSTMRHELEIISREGGLRCPRCAAALRIEVERHDSAQVMLFAFECRSCQVRTNNAISLEMLAKHPDIGAAMRELAERGLASMADYLRKQHPDEHKSDSTKATIEVKDAEAIVNAINALRTGSDLMVEFGMPSPVLEEAIAALEDTLRRHHYPVAAKEPEEPKGRDLHLSLEDRVLTKERFGEPDPHIPF